jgi:alpha-tubulin suppressor-like RCC1 family protein
VPVQVQGLADVVGIAAGGSGDPGSNFDVSMALTWDGKLYTWGHNGYGQLGTSNFTDSWVPQLVSGLTAPVVSFSTGGFHALALLDNGTLWAWGDNSSGELGDGTTTLHPSPIMVGSGLLKTIELITGRVHSFAFLGDFSLFAWGDNGGGQLGDGTQNTKLSPVPVVGF